MYVYSRFPAFPFYDFSTEFPRATGISRRPGNADCSPLRPPILDEYKIYDWLQLYDLTSMPLRH